MSGRLVRDVLTYAPEDLSKTELLVLVCLAEDARDTDRIAHFITVEQVSDRARISPPMVKKTLHRLQEVGLIRGTVAKPGYRRRQLYQITKLGPEDRHATVKKKSRTKTNGHKVELPPEVTQLVPRIANLG